MTPAPDVKTRNVLFGLDDEVAARVRALSERGEFFWLDLDLDSPGVERLGDVLPIPERVTDLLLDFDSSTSFFRRTHVDEDRVAFPFLCARDPEAPPLSEDSLQTQEVHVLVTGGCLVTVHQGPCVPLRESAHDPDRVTRSEQHFVYSVLSAMVVSLFEALASLVPEAERVQEEFGSAQTGRRHLAFVREGQARLNHLRGSLGPQIAVFEHLSDELPDVRGLGGDERNYFDTIRKQLEHLTTTIDAANDALGGLLDLALNRMTFLFTVVATVFLPLTFLAGFWGQNFDYLAQNITSPASFWVLGVGLLVIAVAGSLWAIRRQLGPREKAADG